MSVRHIVAALLLLGAAPAMAQRLDINLNNDTARITYVSSLGKQGMGRGELEGSVLFTNDDTFMGDVGLGVVGAAGTGSPGLLVGVAAKLYGINTKDNDVGALTLGARFDFAPPSVPRLRFGGAFNYAPSILTFMDGDSFYDNNIYVGYEIFQDAVAYVGYRHIRMDVGNGHDVDIDNGGHIGINFRF